MSVPSSSAESSWSQEGGLPVVSAIRRARVEDMVLASGLGEPGGVDASIGQRRDALLEVEAQIRPRSGDRDHARRPEAGDGNGGPQARQGQGGDRGHRQFSSVHEGVLQECAYEMSGADPVVI